jgi:hypothetical protein
MDWVQGGCSMHGSGPETHSPLKSVMGKPNPTPKPDGDPKSTKALETCLKPIRNPTRSINTGYLHVARPLHVAYQ